MKRFVFMFFFYLGCIAVHSQEYALTSEGVDNSGNYSVRIVVSTKKASKSAEDLVRLYAIHGVMFRGIAAAKEYSAQPPLINDPNVEQTKKVWFDAFWSEGAYKRYATIIPSSVSVLKNKATKKVETSALVKVSHSSLKAYLEKEGIIQGLSNLW